MEQSDWVGVLAPGLADITALAEAARAALPPEFAAAAKDVAIRVKDIAPDALLDDLGFDNPLALSGLYEGVPLTQKSVMDAGAHVDVIWLFRRAILDEWAARGDITLDLLVNHVFVHELAHHLGWSDGDIAAIDRWWE